MSVAHPLDLDRHRAGQPDQEAGAGIRNHGHAQLWNPAIHHPNVLKCEASAPTMQRSGHPLHCHVPGRTFDVRAHREHLALACGNQIAMESLVDRHPADRRVAHAFSRCL